MLCGSLPCAPEAIIAPIWTDLDFRGSGVMFYRTSQDPKILGQIASSIADVNPALSDYHPTLAVIVTWFEARSHFDDVCSTYLHVLAIDMLKLLFALMLTGTNNVLQNNCSNVQL